MPNTEPVVQALSNMELGRVAAITPNVIPTIVAKIIAVNANTKVLGIRSDNISLTLRLLTYERLKYGFLITIDVWPILSTRKY